MIDDLGEFISVCVPRLEYAVMRNNGNEKYAFKQAFFYQLEQHFAVKVRISRKANDRAKLLGVQGLGKMTLSEANDAFKHKHFAVQLHKLRKESLFKHRRKKAKCFHYAHVVTGSMVWDAIRRLHDEGRLNPQEIEAYVRENLCVAWILPEEDAKLAKSDRGMNVNDALGHYKAKADIEFVEEEGENRGDTEHH